MNSHLALGLIFFLAIVGFLAVELDLLALLGLLVWPCAHSYLEDFQ